MSKRSQCGACCFPLPCTFPGSGRGRFVQIYSSVNPLTLNAFSLTQISVKLITCGHCSLMNLCFFHVVAVLLYKDQNSPASWQWLTRFEFGSFGGVSLSIRLIKRPNS